MTDLSLLHADRRPVTDHPLAEVLAARFSPRSFASDPVDDATLAAVFEAARWAPSALNRQPWSFVVAHAADPERFERLASVLYEPNRRWAAAAPVLGIAVAQTSFDGTPHPSASYDLGLAMGMLVVQATSLGLAVHQMGGFDADAARTALAIPADREAVVAFALGRRGEPDGLPEDLLARETAPRQRKPLAEVLRTDPWEEPVERSEAA